MYRSTSGLAWCTGMLGPWLMGGQTGWSTSQGTLKNAAAAEPADGRRCLPASGSGSLLAQVPRFAWLYPSQVMISATFRFHGANGGLQLTGVGQLVKTPKSPIASSFTIAGTAALSRNSNRSCTAPHWSGSLTLAFTVSTV